MITIISYGSGNIKAFINIFEKMNIDTKIADNSDSLEGATKIIIPGVGAYDEAMNKLNQTGMRNKLEIYAKEKRVPILGICVGMQIMGNSSEEGNMRGLGWIPGAVKKLPSQCIRQPHMGWNLIKIKKNNKLLSNLEVNSRYYFLHSFYFDTFDKTNILSETDYNFNFASSIQNDNIYGIQFHPEKSHNAGYQLLKNFAKL